MSAELVLYTNPMSRGCIARWLLEETGLDYRVEMVGFGQAMRNPDYLAINPMGKVPALVHGSAVVTEVAAICAYIADTFPDLRLGPEGNEERARYFRWMFFAAGPLESAVLNRALGWEVPPEKSRMAAYGNYTTTIDALDKAIGSSAYITGDRFTAADVYVGSHIIWGLRFGSIDNRTSFKAYAERLSRREAFKRQNELDAKAGAAMGCRAEADPCRASAPRNDEGRLEAALSYYFFGTLGTAPFLAEALGSGFSSVVFVADDFVALGRVFNSPSLSCSASG